MGASQKHFLLNESELVGLIMGGRGGPVVAMVTS